LTGSPVWLEAYDTQGALVAGPVPGGRPVAVGADGTIYGLLCNEQDWTQPSSLVGYTPDFRETMRVDLNGYCPEEGVALSDDGVLYLVRGAPSPAGAEVVAVQTRSPGLARSSWPIVGKGDNGGTRWLVTR
jgi:hypothetical protein